MPGRLQRIDSSSGFTILIDYAHKPDALKQVLQNLSEFKKKELSRCLAAVGTEIAGKRPLMGETATFYSDLTIVTSDNPRLEDPLAIIAEIETGIDHGKIKKIAPENLQFNDDAHTYTVIPERRKAIETAISAAKHGDIVLIAGKGHEDYQILGTNKIPFDDRVVVEQTLKFKESIKSKLMNNDSPVFSLKDVLKATTGTLISGAPENTFYGISTDSRQVFKGNLFIALKGEKFDGHDFIQKAYRTRRRRCIGRMMKKKLIKFWWIKLSP